MKGGGTLWLAGCLPVYKWITLSSRSQGRQDRHLSSILAGGRLAAESRDLAKIETTNAANEMRLQTPAAFGGHADRGGFA